MSLYLFTERELRNCRPELITFDDILRPITYIYRAKYSGKKFNEFLGSS